MNFSPSLFLSLVLLLFECIFFFSMYHLRFNDHVGKPAWNTDAKLEIVLDTFHTLERNLEFRISNLKFGKSFQSIRGCVFPLVLESWMFVSQNFPVSFCFLCSMQIVKIEFGWLKKILIAPINGNNSCHVGSCWAMIQPCVSLGTQGKAAQRPCLPECIEK